MDINCKISLPFLLCSSILINQNLFAHGYQTAPYSRTAYIVDSGQKSQLNYNPNQISNNLPSNLGNKSLKEIIDYLSETNGTGPLAFYKDYYSVHGDELCAYTVNNQGYLPILNQPIPENKMSKVSAGEPVQFKWSYSAWHNPSNNFVFITEYPAGQYKPNPNLNDLHFVCAVAADSSGAWQCKLPDFRGDSKQVIVTIWQRLDAAGENFISCADVKVENGIVPPENIWLLLGNQISWISTLIEQPKAGELVNFTLEGEKQGSKQESLLASYSLPITTSNLSTWDSILASKINNDSTNSKTIAIGQLNTDQGNVVYNKTDLNNNYVYLNKTTSDPKVTYSYTLTVEQDPNPIIKGWQQVGEPLKTWVNAGNVRTNDELQFALQVAGIEQKLKTVVVSNVENAEKLIASEVNKSTFNNALKVAAGVLYRTDKDANIQFVEGGDNRVYVYRSTDDTTTISYVVRNLTQEPAYPIYPANMGNYKAGSLVQNKAGQVYVCVETGWCNQAAYSLAFDGAWKAVHPKPAPDGYLRYPAGQPYSNGNIASDIEGNLYKCTQAGWCNDQSGVYSPGMGRAWPNAWEQQP